MAIPTHRISILSRLNWSSGEYYWVIAVDGVALDVLLEQRAGGIALEGLVPTLLDWLSDPVERGIVWERVLPAVGDVVRLPLLMCPDDIDFYCTLVVAEVVADATHVYWRRLGTDVTADLWKDLHAVGSEVNWLDAVGSFVFEKEEYAGVVEAFRGHLGADAPLYPRV